MAECSLHGQLLVVGGKDPDDKPTTVIHTYNTTTNSWGVISHMTTPPCSVAVLPHNELMIVGGSPTCPVCSRHGRPIAYCEMGKWEDWQAAAHDLWFHNCFPPCKPLPQATAVKELGDHFLLLWSIVVDRICTPSSVFIASMLGHTCISFKVCVKWENAFEELPTFWTWLHFVHKIAVLISRLPKILAEMRCAQWMILHNI